MTTPTNSTGDLDFLTLSCYNKSRSAGSVTDYEPKEGEEKLHLLMADKDIDEFNREIASECSLMYYSNFREASDTTSKSYMDILSLATVIVVIVSLIIAAFILYVLISVHLSNKKREHGILKSLGFVTKDIIYQTVVSILPTCVLAVVTGLWLSRSGASKILILAVRKMGIFTFGSPTDVVLLLIAGIGVTAFTVMYSLLLSSSVRTITPHELFNKE